MDGGLVTAKMVCWVREDEARELRGMRTERKELYEEEGGVEREFILVPG